MDHQQAFTTEIKHTSKELDFKFF